jgi:hypothetical protein
MPYVVLRASVAVVFVPVVVLVVVTFLCSLRVLRGGPLPPPPLLLLLFFLSHTDAYIHPIKVIRRASSADLFF